MKEQAASPSTLCVHAGTQIDQHTLGVNTPVHTSSAFGYRGANGNQYPRYFNTPNQQAVVQKLCRLEGAEEGLLFSSGMAAISAIILGLLKQGDHLVLPKEIYGGTYHFISRELPRFGISYTCIDSTKPEGFAAAIQENTRMLYLETPSNPLLKLTDIEAVSRLARKKGLVSAIDNTFASPINQNPLALGIDLVMHSGTKYLGGHSDLCFGAVAGSKELMKQIQAYAINIGGSLNAETCALIERSMKTLALRVERQTLNAGKIAAYLEQESRIRKVNYPGLESHPQHQLARRQMKGFGAMLSFELDGDAAATERFLDSLQMIMPALSLGGIETLICTCAQTSHLKMSPEERAEAGISDTLLRLSVGIEEADDIIADIQQALNYLQEV